MQLRWLTQRLTHGRRYDHRCRSGLLPAAFQPAAALCLPRDGSYTIPLSHHRFPQLFLYVTGLFQHLCADCRAITAVPLFHLDVYRFTVTGFYDLSRTLISFSSPVVRQQLPIAFPCSERNRCLAWTARRSSYDLYSSRHNATPAADAAAGRCPLLAAQHRCLPGRYLSAAPAFCNITIPVRLQVA